MSVAKAVRCLVVDDEPYLRSILRAFERHFSDVSGLPIATPIPVGALHEAAVAALER